jgi:hypothetical protein
MIAEHTRFTATTHHADHVQDARTTELTRLRESLRAGTFGQVRQIGIVLDESTVRVTGQSASYYARQLATHTLQTCRPDLQVENEIRVVRA